MSSSCQLTWQCRTRTPHSLSTSLTRSSAIPGARGGCGTRTILRSSSTTAYRLSHRRQRPTRKRFAISSPRKGLPDSTTSGALVAAFGDELANRHALGHFTCDVLLKLGLLGTVVGFILMLLPIGEIEEFDPSLMRELLSAMSAGMAVALYTTLAGLTTSTRLKLQ